MQQMWSNVAMMGMLTICSVQDIIWKQIRLDPVLGFGILGVIFHLLWQQQTIGSILMGMMVGIGLLLLSLLSRGRIGAGDGVLLIVTGVYLGLQKNLALLFYALLICGCFALFLLLTRRKRRQDAIPFVPFLLIAYIFLLAGVI